MAHKELWHYDVDFPFSISLSLYLSPKCAYLKEERGKDGFCEYGGVFSDR